MMIVSILLAAVNLAQVFANEAAWKKSPSEYARYERRGTAKWNETEVWETRFVGDGEGGTGRVEMNIYNRGDDKHGKGMTESEMLQIAEAACPGFNKTKVQKRKLKSGGFQHEYKDEKSDPAIEINWGTSEGAVDYLRITMVKKGGKGKASAAGKNVRGKVAGNVRKEANGDVWLDNVPMVNQGDKGYCAVATCERVLRYYGANVDEHQLAQMAGTTAEDGTSREEMRETAKRMGSQYRLGYNEIVSMHGSRKEAEKELESYNKAAKAMKRPELDASRFTANNVFSLPRMMDAMESEVLLRARSRDARFKKFLAGVKSRVDAGIPVFWSVRLGVFPEPDIPQADGGHMRLIIGYNQKTHEIIYSDSWGKGHEKKRMSEDKAFAITKDAFTLRPLQ